MSAYYRWLSASEDELTARLAELDAGAEPMSPGERSLVVRRLAFERRMRTRPCNPTSMWSPFADQHNLAPDAKDRAARDGRV